ncbi:MAG TPA: protein kinase [Thermoanaerobaculia bacterium]|nr:protein kinase [Thermoanaerobaculia bacterium]
MSTFHCIRCKAEISRDFKACPHCGEPVTEFLKRYADEPIDGKYRIVERLGTGGMGEVYKVTHTYLGATRVIKVIRPQISGSEDVNDRFLREARAATKVQHPNVATLHDFSALPDGSHYMVWEYIEGQNLAQRIHSRGTLPPRYAVDLVIQALHGLDAIHRAGIIHRDISPENLMITREPGGEERVRIIDMGVAKVDDATENVTRAGVFVGKLRYASPEHLGFLQEGDNIDARADLYSLGVVLYEMLTGRPPYEASTPHQYVMLHSRDTQFKPLNLPADLPAGAQLQSILAKALERDRNKRWSSAREFAAALEDVEKTLPDPSSQATISMPTPVPGVITKPDTLHRSTVRTGMGDGAPTVRTPLPGPLANPPAAPKQAADIVAREESSSGAAIAIVALVFLVALAAIAFVFVRSRAARRFAANRQRTSTIASQLPAREPVKPQTNVDVVSPAPVTTTTAALVPAPTDTASAAPAPKKKKVIEKPVEQPPAETPVERPAPAPIRAYVEGGDSGSNDQLLSDARQKLRGVTRIAVRATNPEMQKQLAKQLQHQGVTVSDGAETVVDFDGVLERLGRGKKRRSAHATVSKDGHVVFRYEMPPEEYRVGDTPVEAFARVVSDAIK